MAGRGPFATTWWGTAWVQALEEAAALDPTRLSRGRTYARGGNVGSITIQPGFASAVVRGRHGHRYQTDVAVRSLAPSEWDQVAAAISTRAAHAAALLDGELPPDIVADAAELDVRLLPGPGDLRPDCSCPDWAEPCKHAAALCYLLAAEIDRDPFVLFELRGISPSDLLELIRRHRGVGPDRDRDTESLGIDASDGWSRWADTPLDTPLPPVPATLTALLGRVGDEAATPPPSDLEIPPDAGFRAADLDQLGADAAERAAASLRDGTSLGLGLNHDADLARRAATLDGTTLRQFARRIGMRPETLAAWSEAWRIAGATGVAMLQDDGAWSTDQTALAAGREDLVELGYSRRSVSLNYDSLRMRGNVWLALGPDHRWYRLRERGQRRELHVDRAPSEDICDLVDPPPSTSPEPAPPVSPRG